MNVRVSNYSLHDIHPGMFATFTKKIIRSDAENYAALVGDISPLHVDSGYGRRTAFEGNLVHGMFVSGLFSTLVGVFLPGRNALLGGMNVDFVHPVPVGSKVTVTASVVTVLPDESTVKIRLIAYVNGRVCVRGEAFVYIRQEIKGIDTDAEIDLQDAWAGSPDDLKTALITGATGLVGYEIASQLGREGWRIGIHYHRNEVKAQELLEAVIKSGGRGCLLQGSLGESPHKVRRIAEMCREQLGPVGLVVHAACPPFTPTDWLEREKNERLYAVQIDGLRQLLPAVLPDMIRSQYGYILAIGSEAICPPYLAGWQTYVSVKYALQGFMGSLADAYDGCGVCIGSVLAGAVRGDSSLIGTQDWDAQRDIRKRWPVALPPQSLARAIVEIVDGRSGFPNGSVIVLKGIAPPELRIRGLLSASGWASAKPSEEGYPVTGKEMVVSEPTMELRHDPVRDRLRDLFCRVLNLENSTPVEAATLGELPGWDSLNHLKLLMAVEEEFDVSLEGAEELYSFDQILKRIRS